MPDTIKLRLGEVTPTVEVSRDDGKTWEQIGKFEIGPDNEVYFAGKATPWSVTAGNGQTAETTR